MANGNIKGQDGADGADGPQGVQGPPGEDGTPRYTWIRYADDASGTGISNDPTGKDYIGLAHNKTTALESSNPADYSWSLIVGPEGPQGNTGIQGPPGADGTPRYIWVKYAANSTGSSGFSDVPLSNTEYIGIAPNKTVASESSNPADYTWSLFKGADGQDGQDGPVGPIGPPGPEGPEADVTIINDSGSATFTGGWTTICSITVPAGDIQLDMSGRAIYQSEENDSATVEVRFVHSGTTVIRFDDDTGTSAGAYITYSNQFNTPSRTYTVQARVVGWAGGLAVRNGSGFITATEL